MSKSLRNTTGSAILISAVGIEIAAGDTYVLVVSEHTRWAEEDSITEITPYINSGDIVVNDGNIDLIPTEGLAFVQYPDNAKNERFDVPASTEGNFGVLTPLSDESVETALRNAAKVVRVSSTDTRTRHLEDKVTGGSGINIIKMVDGVTGEEVLKLDSTGTSVGKGFQTAFIANGTVKNEWIHSEDQNISSDSAPDVFKYGARCTGIDYTNDSHMSDPIIIVCISNAGNGRNLDRFYKYTLTHARVAVRTHDTLGFTVSAGDKMGVYVRDGGGDPFDMVLTMDFIVTNADNIDIVEDYHLDFRSSDIPNTNAIPEILE